MGPQVRTSGPAGVPDAPRGTRRRCSAACTPRLETLAARGPRPSAHQDGPTAAVPCGRRPQGSDTQPDQVAPGAAAAFRCSVHRPRMRQRHRPRMGGSFTWNRRQCPGSRRPSVPDAGPGLSHEGTVRCSRRWCSVISDAHRPPGSTWNRAGPPLRVPGRSGCPDGPDVSRGTGGGVRGVGAQTGRQTRCLTGRLRRCSRLTHVDPEPTAREEPGRRPRPVPPWFHVDHVGVPGLP